MSIVAMLSWVYLIFLLFEESFTTSYDSPSSLGHKFDKAALDLLRAYDDDRGWKEAEKRLSLQKEDVVFRSILPLQDLETHNPVDITTTTIKSCSGMTVHLMAIANQGSSEKNHISTVNIYRYELNTMKFSKIYNISSVLPYKLEFLTVKKADGSKMTLLAIAGNSEHIENDQDYSDARLEIYEIKCKGGNITAKAFQHTEPMSFDALSSITRNEKTYLVAGIRLHSKLVEEYPAKVLILRYNTQANYFEFHSSLDASSYIGDIGILNVEDKLIMFVAFNKDRKNNVELRSPLYSFDESNEKFSIFQTIQTHGANNVESFSLQNDHFLVIANAASEERDVESSFYKFKDGRFVLVDDFRISGATSWSSLVIPNCKGTVLLAYVDQRDDADQVGFLTYKKYRQFEKLPLSLYDSEFSSFRPRVIVTFTFGEELFIAVGARNNDDGHTLYKVEYENNAKATPAEHMAGDILNEINELQRNLTSVFNKVVTLEQSIVNTDEVQHIQGSKVFKGNFKVDNLIIKNLNSIFGNFVLNQNGISSSPIDIENSLTYIMNAISTIEGHIKDLKQAIDKAPMVVGNVSLETDANFSSARFVYREPSVKQLLIPSCILANVNVCHLKKDIVLNESSDNITGVKTFSNSVVLSKNLHMISKLNNVIVAKDLVHSSGSQEINSKKIFEKGIDFPSAMLSGKFNGIELENDTLGLHKNEVINGKKLVKSRVEARIANVAGLIDEVNVTDLKQGAMDAFSMQYITGKKTLLRGSRVQDNINVSGLTNKLDLDELSRNLVAAEASMHTHKNDVVFMDKVHMLGNLSVSGTTIIDNLTFPDDVVLLTGKQDITGQKIFHAKISLKGNLKSGGLVDKINISNIVRTSRADEITGKKNFLNNINLLKNINVSRKTFVNGVDLSEFGDETVTLYGKQKIKGKITFNTPFTAHACLNVIGNMDQLPIEFFDKLFKFAVTHDSSQVIKGQLSLTKRLVVNQNLSVNGLINGYAFPNSFLVTFGNQIINISTTFYNIYFENNMHISSEVNGFYLDQLSKIIVQTGTNQVISGIKTFIDDVIVDGNVEYCCGTKNRPLGNVLTKITPQVVSASKSFIGVNSRKTLRATVENITVASTVDGVDLSELKPRLLCRKDNMEIDRNIKFIHVMVKKNMMPRSVNGFCLEMLKNDLVTINTDQTIPSRKFFETVLIDSGMLTNSSIDDCDLAQLSRNVVKTNEPAIMNGNKVFKHISANNVEISGVVHGVDLSQISEAAVVRTRETVISGMKTIHGLAIIKENLTAISINDLKVPEQVVVKGSKQEITGRKEFIANTMVNGDLVIIGTINNENISSMYQHAVLKSKRQHIRGRKVISNDVKSKASISINEKINGVDLSDLNRTSVKIKGNTVIRGSKSFSVGVNFQDSIRVKGLINNRDWYSVTKDAVLKHNLQNITGYKVFKEKLRVTNGVLVDGEGVSTGLINQVNISLLDRNTLKTQSNQVVTGKKKWSKNVIFQGKVNAAMVCNKETKDFISIKGNQTIKGHKVFPGIHALDDVVVDGHTDGVKLVDIVEDTLFISKPQSVKGLKKFVNHIKLKGSLTSLGKIDFNVIDSKKIMALYSNQSIEGKVIFQHDITSHDVTVHRTLSGLNITEIKDKRVTLNSKQQIKGTVVIAKQTNTKDLTVSGTVNGVDVKSWHSLLTSVLKTSEATCHRLTNISQSYCPAFEHLKTNFGNDSRIYIDYNKVKQSFKYNINHISAFRIEDKHFIAIVRAFHIQHDCKATEVMILDNAVGQYVIYQFLSPAVESRFKSFESNKEMFLFLENAENGCMPKGKSILYKWNSNTSLFETYQYIETSTVRHSNVMKNGTDTFLAIANREPQSVEVWTWKSKDSGFVRTQIISDSSPAAVEFFMIDDNAFMAISNDYDPVLQSTKALSVIHRLNRSSRKWERLQDIPTDSAHDVKYFRDSKHHYVAFTSGEIDVYRYSESSGLFSCDHSIKASSPVGMQLIHLENAMFLVVVSNREGIVVYRERLHFNYELVAAIPHTSVTHVTAFLC